MLDLTGVFLFFVYSFLRRARLLRLKYPTNKNSSKNKLAFVLGKIKKMI